MSLLAVAPDVREHALLDAAKQVMQAIERVTADPQLHTRDLSGKASTADVTQAVCEFLAAPSQRKAA